jgi:hypothetical protein
VSTGTVVVTIPAKFDLNTYFLLACADDTGRENEFDEGNCRTSAATVKVTLPDLAETAVSNPPATVGRGDRFSVVDSVENRGEVAAKGSTTRFYLSSAMNRVPGAIRLAGSRSVDGLAPTASSAASAVVGVPANTPPGTYFLLACANDTSRVAEIDRSNNCAVAPAPVIVNP